MKYYADIKHVSGLGNTSRARAHIRYIMRNGDGNFTIGSLVKDNPRDTGAAWGAMIDRELMRRKDARYQTRLIMAVPNSFSERQTRDYIKSLEGEFFSDMKTTIAHHNNEGNKHLHIVYNDTLISSGRKNLKLRNRSFLGELKKFSEGQFRAQGIEMEAVTPGTGRHLYRAEYEAQKQGPDMAALMGEQAALNEVIYAAAEAHMQGRAANGQSRTDIGADRTTDAGRSTGSGLDMGGNKKSSTGDSSSDSAGSGADSGSSSAAIPSPAAPVETMADAGPRNGDYYDVSDFDSVIPATTAKPGGATTTRKFGVNLEQGNAPGARVYAGNLQTVKAANRKEKNKKEGINMQSENKTWGQRLWRRVKAKKAETEKINAELKAGSIKKAEKKENKEEDYNPFAGYIPDLEADAARRKRLDTFFAPVVKQVPEQVKTPVKVKVKQPPAREAGPQPRAAELDDFFKGPGR